MGLLVELFLHLAFLSLVSKRPLDPQKIRKDELPTEVP
jgi:hypothetical protein